MDMYDQLIETALGSRLGDDVAKALLSKINSYSNFPNAVKGTAKTTGAPDVELAALAVVEDEALITDFDSQKFWALLTLAARADISVVDRIAGKVGDLEYAQRLLRTIQRAAAKHASGAAGDASRAPSQGGAQTELQPPQKASEVKAWLAAHPDSDVAVLAPYVGQKAAARVAAIRALGALGTPRALEVLGQYAEDSYPDAVLKELHQAWRRFDRREFAAKMFRQAPYTLDLGLAPSIEGIGAVRGLTSLDVVLTGGADLLPLAECAELRTLRVGAEGSPGLLGVEPLLNLHELTELHLTRNTRHADLTPLTKLGVRRLRLDLGGADGSFLLRMPQLERLLISGDEAWDEDVASEAATKGERQALADVAIALVRKGVRVVVYKHQRAWVTGLLEQAHEAADIFTHEESGYVGLTHDESALDQLGKDLFWNLVP